MPCVSKLKENANISEYQDGEVQDNVYESVLKQAYAMFRLFHGDFLSSMPTSDATNLQKRLLVFYEEVCEFSVYNKQILIHLNFST